MIKQINKNKMKKRFKKKKKKKKKIKIKKKKSPQQSAMKGFPTNTITKNPIFVT